MQEPITPGDNIPMAEQASAAIAITATKEYKVAHEDRNTMHATLGSLEESLEIAKAELAQYDTMIDTIAEGPMKEWLIARQEALEKSYNKQLVTYCNLLYREIVANHVLSPQQKEDFNLTWWINAMIDMYAPTFAEKKILPEKAGLLRLENIEYLVHGAKNTLLYALVNLIQNAIKFTHKHHPEGGGEITITLEQRGDQFYLSINDNGIGMTEEQVGVCFGGQKFNEDVAGNGSGLPNIKLSLHNVGGNITVNSKEGEGSCFEIQVPLQLKYQINKAAPLDCSAIRVLIVEDEPISKKMLQAILVNNGFQAKNITITESYDTAVSLTSPSNPFHIILTDMTFKGGDGLALINHIRNEEAKSPTVKPSKIIMLSGTVDPTIPSSCAELNADFLKKPYQKDALLTSLLRYIDELNSQQQLPTPPGGRTPGRFFERRSSGSRRGSLAPSTTNSPFQSPAPVTRGLSGAAASSPVLGNSPRNTFIGRGSMSIRAAAASAVSAPASPLNTLVESPNISPSAPSIMPAPLDINDDAVVSSLSFSPTNF